MENEILVVGPGALGGYLAFTFARARLLCSVLGRGEHARQIQKEGLTISGVVQGNCRLAPAKKQTYRWIFLAVKNQDLFSTLLEIQKNVGSDTVLITLQNGVDAEEMVRSQFPDQNLISGLAYLDGWIPSAGVVEISWIGRYVFGETKPLPAKIKSDFLKLLSDSNLAFEWSDQIHLTKWKKLCWNSVSNAISLLTRRSGGDLKSSDVFRPLMKDILMEVQSVARAEGVPLEDEFLMKLLHPDETKASGNPKSKSSMWADYQRGKTLEIDFLNGAISRLGQKHSIPTPVNDTITTLVRLLQPIENLTE